MKYDPSKAPNPKQWLRTDEALRLEAVHRWFADTGFPNEDEARARAAILATLETQIASKDPAIVAETLSKLTSDGLDRLLAVLALAAVLDQMMRESLIEKTELDVAEYQRRIGALDVEEIEASAAIGHQLEGGPPPPFDMSQQELLEAFAERHTDEGTLPFPAMAGFLFAVVCAPGFPLPSEWLHLVLGEAEFENDQEADDIIGAIFALLNWVSEEVNTDNGDPLPEDCVPDPDPMANLEEGSRFGLWCEGFARGQMAFEQEWLNVLTSDDRRTKLSFNFMGLSFFSSQEVAREIHSDLAKISELGSFQEMATQLHQSIPDAIADYIDLALEVRNQGQAPPAGPARSTKIGRNQPCPCGSGKKYKKCCGRPGQMQ